MPAENCNSDTSSLNWEEFFGSSNSEDLLPCLLNVYDSIAAARKLTGGVSGSTRIASEKEKMTENDTLIEPSARLKEAADSNGAKLTSSSRSWYNYQSLTSPSSLRPKSAISVASMSSSTSLSSSRSSNSSNNSSVNPDNERPDQRTVQNNSSSTTNLTDKSLDSLVEIQPHANRTKAIADTQPRTSYATSSQYSEDSGIYSNFMRSESLHERSWFCNDSEDFNYTSRVVAEILETELAYVDDLHQIITFLSWTTIAAAAASTSAKISPDSAVSKLRNIPGDSVDWWIQREQNLIYADKTIYLERMLNDELYRIFFFILRARRFGKSTFLRMAECFFNGYDKPFKGLHIYNRGNVHFFKGYSSRSFSQDKLSENQTWIQCPVILLDFSKSDHFSTIEEFKSFYKQQLSNIAAKYDLEYASHSDPEIDSLIFQLYLKFKWNVVVLIDEYDAPYTYALYHFNNPKLAKEIRVFMNIVLGSINASREYLRLVLVLGISRLSMKKLDSRGSNVYVDLTFDERFTGAFGFTEADIQSFYPEIDSRFGLKDEKSREELIKTMRDMYDGYNFAFQNSSTAVNVLNPVSTMKFLSEKILAPYWISTGSMSEITRRLYFAQIPLKTFEQFNVSRDDILQRRDPATEAIPIQILMFLHGYLTINVYYEKKEIVTLAFPNEEIRTALEKEMKTYHPKKQDYELAKSTCLLELDYYIWMGNIEGTMGTLSSMFLIDSETLEQGVIDLNTYGPTIELDITRRLVGHIRRSGISCNESKKFEEPSFTLNEGGVIDVMTIFPEPILVMKVKIEFSAIYAIKKLIRYLEEYREKFLDAICHPKSAFFVGVNVIQHKYGGKLNEWIAIPWENGTLMYDQMVASPNTLISELLEEIDTAAHK